MTKIHINTEIENRNNKIEDNNKNGENINIEVCKNPQKKDKNETQILRGRNKNINKNFKGNENNEQDKNLNEETKIVLNSINSFNNIY